MADVLIVYGSTTGNTETVADNIAEILKGSGHNVTVQDAGKTDPAGLCAGRDCVLFGSSTWGDDSIVLQDDFAVLFEAFDAIGASGVKTAVFGCGDSGYTYFCGAVDSIYDKLEELGAHLIAPKLKIDGDPADADDEIASWTAEVAAAL
ncbi:MAG: flavodoxin [Desulfovibrio sp.]|jgi:flavodoxin short chain|nr:flavodoxin [Desulfovibrio sp.]